MAKNLFNARVEMIAIKHHDIPTPKTKYFDISSHADDLKPFAPSEARMGALHFYFVIKGIFGNYHGLSSIFTAAGTLGRPGIVRTAPVRGTTKRAPAERRTSRTWML